MMAFQNTGTSLYDPTLLSDDDDFDEDYGDDRPEITTEQLIQELSDDEREQEVNDDMDHSWFTPTPEYDPNVEWSTCPSVFTDTDTNGSGVNSLDDIDDEELDRDLHDAMWARVIMDV
jgi:hypothetical protein